jgi:phage terminase large subunit GpA-like protein
MTALTRVMAHALSVLRPPPDLTLSQWAECNLYLSAEDSSEPGLYNADRAPYQRGILDAISDPTVESVVGMLSAQVGKTLMLKSTIGYYVDQDPSTILVVQPNVEMAETFSKDRLAPMIRDSPALRGKIADSKSRDSGNTILHKQFAAGHITMVGANAPAGLASRPIRIVLLDEVDRYPASAGTEGDPVKLAIARTKSFWNRRVVMFSTPGDADTSRILKAFDLSDQRRFHVACQHCGERQVLRWEQVSWADGDPATAVYVCEHCDTGWGEAERYAAVQAGEWQPEHPERRIAGFHLNELYSPFRKLAEIVADFLEAKDSPELLKTFVNTSLGEPWREEEGERVQADIIAQRREPYAEPPPAALCVTMSVDTQDDRLEIEFVAWGKGEESWGVEHKVLHGDPGRPEIWDKLTAELGRTFRRDDGAVLAVSACAIDSAGHYTREVYAWCQRHRGRAFPLVGRAGAGRPLVEVSKRPLKQHGVKLLVVGVDTAKELLLMSRLKITTPGPQYCHFPARYEMAFFHQLTAETRRTVYVQGRPTYRWTCKKGDRNEALDLRVYSLALIHLLRPAWDVLASQIVPPESAPPPPRHRPIAPRGTMPRPVPRNLG